MTPTALYTSIGGLVNEVLLRVLDEIEAQADISEEESIRLNKLCKMLHELESLFDGSEVCLPGWEYRHGARSLRLSCRQPSGVRCRPGGSSTSSLNCSRLPWSVVALSPLCSVTHVLIVCVDRPTSCSSSSMGISSTLRRKRSSRSCAHSLQTRRSAIKTSRRYADSLERSASRLPADVAMTEQILRGHPTAPPEEEEW